MPIDSTSHFRELSRLRRIAVALASRCKMSEAKTRTLLEQLFSNCSPESLDSNERQIPPFNITITNFTGDFHVHYGTTPAKPEGS